MYIRNLVSFIHILESRVAGGARGADGDGLLRAQLLRPGPRRRSIYGRETPNLSLPADGQYTDARRHISLCPRRRSIHGRETPNLSLAADGQFTDARR